ncbi:MAG: hypothetical protein ACR2NN_17160 [Bryobacteraceae bacterium]
MVAIHPGANICQSLPGAGAALAPRLVAAFETDRERFASAGEGACATGTQAHRTGPGAECKNDWTHFRFACSKFCRKRFMSGLRIQLVIRFGHVLVTISPLAGRQWDNEGRSTA